MHQFRLIVLAVFISCASGPVGRSAEKTYDADLLIVGGGESGCAAAVQAARMGVRRIILVNDIDWLGGQFSAESVVAIDENTHKTGIRHEQPIPRHGLFKEIITRIERRNRQRYGVARPGNTRVITTCRPADAAAAFEDLLKPYVKSGQLTIIRHAYPVAATVVGKTLKAVRFRSTKPGKTEFTVRAKMTIDASDWGDVIRAAGAEYEFGPDLRRKYGEPEAPTASRTQQTRCRFPPEHRVGRPRTLRSDPDGLRHIDGRRDCAFRRDAVVRSARMTSGRVSADCSHPART